MSNIDMNKLRAIGEEISASAEFLQKEFPEMPSDIAYQLAAIARQERGQANLYKKEREVAEYNTNKLRTIISQLRELIDLQDTNTKVAKAISLELRR